MVGPPRCEDVPLVSGLSEYNVKKRKKKKKKKRKKKGGAPEIDLPSFVRMDQSDIYSSAARNLGVISDSELALNEQVSVPCLL